MFAIVQDGAITRTGSSFRQLFPNTSFPANGPNSAFRSENGVMEVVNAEQKDRKYYYVTQGDIALVDGVPTQQFTNTAMRLEDEDAKDSDGNQLYVQVFDASANGGEGGMVNTSEKRINRGLKYTMNAQVKSQANSALAPTDWMVIRKAERDVAIPSATATYRAAVVTECARLETAIAGAANVDALQAVMQAQNWPEEA
tara:strand:- start:4095 stop:4691 length:597 start_codon:yes stop_codon:yes gene_type:complete